MQAAACVAEQNEPFILINIAIRSVRLSGGVTLMVMIGLAVRELGTRSTRGRHQHPDEGHP
jgi:hypothetical protein